MTSDQSKAASIAAALVTAEAVRIGAGPVLEAARGPGAAQKRRATAASA